MLLVIHNLPSSFRYADVKALIKDKCGLTELIVDNLLAEGKNKKVTVGLADEGDAALLVRKINGLYVHNQQLYVEDVRQQKANEQPYRPSAISHQFVQEQYNQPEINKQFYKQQDERQFQPIPLMSIETKVPSGPPTVNFGVPFYMTAQSQSVDRNPQLTVQYPRIQVPMGNEPYEGRNIGFDQQYDLRKEGRSRSSDRSLRRKNSPDRSWKEPDRDRIDSRSGHVRPQRSDRHDADRSYNEKSYGGSSRSRSNQDYGPNQQSNKNKRIEKPTKYNWRRSDRANFSESSKPSRFSDDNQNRRNNEEKETQRFKEGPQSRGFNYDTQPGDFPRKRPYESPNKNKYDPQNKKFGSNQQFNTKNQQGNSDKSFSDNLQNKKNLYFSKASVQHTNQPSKTKMQPKAQPNKSAFSNNLSIKQSRRQAKFSKDRPDRPEFKKPKPGPDFAMLARNEAWRVQAAALIATQILNNMGKSLNKRDPVVIKLKACIRARIDVAMGEDISLTLGSMLKLYREKFHDDDAFYNEVLKKVRNNTHDELDSNTKDVRETLDQLKVVKKPTVIKPGPLVLQKPSDSARLPIYPDGKKNLLSEIKQAQKNEMKYDTLYNLNAEQEKALENELDMFGELIKQELNNPENETEKSVFKFMKNAFVAELRKILTLHVKKRILDIRTSLSIRVICQYKVPRRDMLDAFLANYGVISLKRSVKNKNVLIAICDSYGNFDALCKVASTEIDNLKISFKPLHLTGIPLKARYTKTGANVAKCTVSYNQINTDVAGIKSNDNNEKNINGDNGSADEDIHKTPKRIYSNHELTQATDIECKGVSNNSKDDNVIVIEDNEVKCTDVIVIDNNDTVNDKDVIVLDDAVIADTKFETVNDDCENAAVNKELLTIDKGGKVDDEKTMDGNEIMEHEDIETIDNDNIADEDLEDF